MDVLGMIYDALMADPSIKETANGRIKFYEFPETGEVTAPFIIIDPLDVPLPQGFADDTWLTYDYLFQIDVWSKKRTTTRELSGKIRHVMWKLGFSQGSGVDEWDKGTGIFRDARRYRGKLYRDYLDTL
ncbi:tail completion protein gp17 [Peribacillus frigoritolerans]|uniref:tail completion protein gp17 n=1 Tax=Peribacillus frigoritolerans TaxID=450367 RepID=UPI0030164BE9